MRPPSGGHTTANEQAYARAVMADPAQPAKDDAEHANSQYYRQLRYEYQNAREVHLDRGRRATPDRKARPGAVASD